MVNVIKSANIPPSLAIEKLKASGHHRHLDVLTQLKEDFKNKCYLCEDYALLNINVEHFKPHKGNKELMFSWNNLYYCCGHCNNIKGDDPRFDNLLDCTDPNIDVLRKIKLTIDPFPFEEVVIEAMDNLPETINTATLLEESYNGTTIIKKLESEGLRDKIITEIKLFQDDLIKYFKPGNNQEDKDNLRGSIRRMLSVESPFTAFKAWIIIQNPRLNAEFGDLVPKPNQL